MLKEFYFSFNDFTFDKTEIENLLGFEDQEIPEPFPSIIDQALVEAAKLCQLRGGFLVINDIEISSAETTIRIESQIFKPGKLVLTQFKNASSIAIFICTAGDEMSKKAQEELSNGDAIFGFVLDTIGSIVVEKVSEKLHELLTVEFKKQSLTVSDRFSPGYCDWSVGEQQKLFALLPENFCGVTLSDTSLMSPIKSISGMIAIGEGLITKGYQCHWCTDKDCIYGKMKRKKMSEKKLQKTVG